MARLIMNDDIDHSSRWHPTHIVSKDKKLIKVYIGAPGHMLGGGIGIYVANEDYDKINHKKAYIFIHNPECKDGDIEDVNWDDIEDADDRLTNRQHMHLWSE